MSVVAPSPLPLVQLPGHRIPPYNSPVSSYSAQRLALLGRARLQLAPPVQQPTHTSHPTNNSAQLSTSFNPISKPIDASSISSKPAQSQLSSVARRKQQLAKSSVPTYAFGDASDNNQASPNIAIDSNESESTTHSISSSHQPTLARIGVVDIRFLTRQPPTVQKSPLQAPKSVSKESSVGSPNSPSAPLSAAAPKNQRPKATTRVLSAAGNGKPSRSRPKATATVDPDTSASTDADKSKPKPQKHAFLFLPESEQPTSGPYIRFSPMYHYYHPYRNLHREAVKAEWARLHPVVEPVHSPEEEEVTTPPRRTSGRQKKTANVRGVAARNKNDKGNKKLQAVVSQTNEVAVASPAPASGRRSRATAKGKGGKPTPKPKVVRPQINSANKRKRAELDEEDKQTAGKEEVPPTPPTKRPRRGAATAAIALSAAAQEAEDAASAKEEVSPTDALDDLDQQRVVKRRMRPNARKTAAARAAAMVAKKQKKKSVDDGEGGGENDEDDEGADSLKEEDSILRVDEPQQDDLSHDVEVELDSTQQDTAVPLGEDESQVDPETEMDKKKPPSKGARGGPGGAKGGARNKGKRGTGPIPRRGSTLTINTRGTPRGTPKSIAHDDETSSLPPETDNGVPIMEAVAEDVLALLPAKLPKPKRVYSNKKGGMKSQTPAMNVERDGISNEEIAHPTNSDVVMSTMDTNEQEAPIPPAMADQEPTTTPITTQIE